VSSLSSLPNIGKVLESNLQQVGIATPDELRQVGTEEAFMRIRAQVDSGACLHILYGIEGAVQGIPDNHLSSETKTQLKQFFRGLG